MNYEITEEQIKELAKANAKVKKMFPEVFEHETGWFKTKEEGNEKYLIFFENGISKYGFNGAGVWRKKTQGETITTDEYLATDSEVEESLINEAKKRDFKEGVYVDNSNICELGSTYLIEKNSSFELLPNNLLVCGNNCVVIFNKGKWAEIVKTYTKEEAEKLLNAKII